MISNAGFIIWNDSKIVTYFSNDMNGTPREDIIIGSLDSNRKYVHGLASIKRWNGLEILHRATVHVPAVIVVYNIFMNYVDRMDQIRSASPTRRKVRRLYMYFLHS